MACDQNNDTITNTLFPLINPYGLDAGTQCKYLLKSMWLSSHKVFKHNV